MYSSEPVVGADPTGGYRESDLMAVDGTRSSPQTSDGPAEYVPMPAYGRVEPSLSLIPLVSDNKMDSLTYVNSNVDLLSSNAGNPCDGSASVQPTTPSGRQPTPRKTDDILSQRDVCVSQLCEIMVDILQRTPKSIEFEKLKTIFYEKMRELEQNHRIEIKRSGNTIMNMRMEMLEDRVRLQTIEKGLHENYNSDLKYKANELLDLRTKEVYNENLELVREKTLLANDVRIARERECALDKENIALRRAVNVNASIESDLKTKCLQYKKEIDKLKKQIKTVEDSMETVTKDYIECLARQDTQHAKQIKALTKERDDARFDALQLNAGLIQLRKASSRVLCQRGELENFFHDALREVREQIVCERHRQLLANYTPGISGRGPTTSQEIVSSSRHTHASALRIENQRLLQLMGCPAAHPTLIPLYQPPHERGEGFYDGTSSPSPTSASQGKRRIGVPSESSTGMEALPPIPHGAASGSTSDQSSQLCVFEPKMESLKGSSPSHGQQGPSSSSPERGALVKGNGLSSRPGGITWKTIGQVDISELGWPDKERVLQLLFERIRMQQQRLARKAIIQEDKKTENSSLKSELADHSGLSIEEVSKSTLFITQT
ncbi:unnamed protein product [Phytomonas sp. Hart1]|nr:unnamed protein product [Phytomonas sp. Hart1]|eukprot:CCW70018.1 unnamed protein product [Phytomonas sp. isolate Hart1]